MRRRIGPGVRMTRTGRPLHDGQAPDANSRHQKRIGLQPPRPRYRHGLCSGRWLRPGLNNESPNRSLASRYFVAGPTDRGCAALSAIEFDESTGSRHIRAGKGTSVPAQTISDFAA